MPDIKQKQDALPAAGQTGAQPAVRAADAADTAIERTKTIIEASADIVQMAMQLGTEATKATLDLGAEMVKVMALAAASCKSREYVLPNVVSGTPTVNLRPIPTMQARAHLFYGGRNQRATIAVPSILADVRPLPQPGFLAGSPAVLRHPATQDETLKRTATREGS